MKTFTAWANIREKTFDGEFYKKTIQDETLEVLQDIGRVVDSRKVMEDQLRLREGVFVLIKRPMTAIGEGYLMMLIVEGSYSDQSNAEAKVVKNYGGNDFKVGSVISISTTDVMAVSEDNMRFYIIYPSQANQAAPRQADQAAPPTIPSNGKVNKKKAGDDDDDVIKAMGKLRKIEAFPNQFATPQKNKKQGSRFYG